jgi:NAD(P)-dependent dehydrogenase (short-subunit alcohol dehydrogenase family)
MMELNGTSAVITGGASGLGAATARALAARGAKVVLADLDRQAEKGEARAKELGGAFVPCDVTSAEQAQAAVDTAVEIAPLWSLVNSAGIGWAGRTIDKNGAPLDLEIFRKVIDINLIGTFNFIRLAASAMNKNTPDADGSRGAIVNTTSIAAFDGQIGQVSYAASKGGVVAITLVVARDLAAAGIRCNTIAPGLIDTPIYGTGPQADAFKEALGKDVLFPRRLGRDTEIASMAIELLTNSYMNGEVIRVDGGIRMPPKSR